MTFTGPPDTYWEPPEPSVFDLHEQAEQDADSLVAEWASEGEYEVWISVPIHTRSGEPFYSLERVAHDGDVLFDSAPGGLGLDFDTIEELRAHLEKTYPLLPQ